MTSNSFTDCITGRVRFPSEQEQRDLLLTEVQQLKEQVQNLQQEVKELKELFNQMKGSFKTCVVCGVVNCVPLKEHFSLGHGYMTTGRAGSICGKRIPEDDEHPDKHWHE